jgi:beta-glucanase (GH16 family)
MWQIKKDGVKKWYYAGGDEFNSDKVDMNMWAYGPPWGNALPKQDAVFTYGENVYQADGTAHFVAKKEHIQARVYPWELDSAWAAKNNRKIENEKMWFNYTMGQLFSNQKYKYGYFECRFKSNEERGIWPAFWLYGGGPNNEIDWFELKGERKDQLHVDVHCPNGCDDYKGGFLNLQKNWGGWEKADRSLAEGFNTISGEWTPEYMIWYLNGTPVSYFKHHYDIRMSLIVNTCVAADKEAFNPGPDKSTKFPNEFLVDYVRIWGEEDSTAKNNERFSKSGGTMQANDWQHAAKLKKPLKFIYDKKQLNGEKGTVTFLPLGNNRYSLTFICSGLESAKVEVLSGEAKVKEFALENPSYFSFDMGEGGGNYTLKISVFDAVLTTDFATEAHIRK